MWKRKTEEDCKKEKEIIFLGLSKEDILLSLLVAVIFAFCCFVHIPSIFSIISCFVIAFVVSCIAARLFGDPATILRTLISGTPLITLHPTVICNVCHSVVSRSNKEKCECGGTYEPLDDWKWVEDEIEESESGN